MHGQTDFLGNTFAAAKAFGITHERLDATQIATRFPQFQLQGDETAYYEPGAGFLSPERCVAAQLQLAKRAGATLRFGEKVESIHADAAVTTVETECATYRPGTTIVCAGAWLPQLLPALSNQLVVSRQVLHWFPVTANVSYDPAQCPIYIWHWGSGPADVFYGFPRAGSEQSIKVATEQTTHATSADDVSREVSIDESAAMFRTHVQHRLHGVNANAVRATTCLYTSTRDANFIIDRLPDARDVIVVSACSGHGFKHSAAIGEAVAIMALSNETPQILQPFQLPAAR